MLNVKDALFNRIRTWVTIFVMVFGLSTISSIMDASLAMAGGTRDGGGGGFQYNNSRPLLKDLSQRLALEIESLNPRIFEKLPVGLRQKEMAAIIRGIRFLPKVEKSRVNDEDEEELLMFDYGKDEKGYYIAALKGYFDAYQSLPYAIMKESLEKNLPVSEMYDDQMRDVRRRLVHEFSHLLGKNEEQAHEFALLFETAARTDLLHCRSESRRFIDRYDKVITRLSLAESARLDQELPAFRRHYLIDRPSGVYIPFETEMGDPAVPERMSYYLNHGVDPDRCYSQDRGTAFCQRQWKFGPEGLSRFLIEFYDEAKGTDIFEDRRAREPFSSDFMSRDPYRYNFQLSRNFDPEGWSRSSVITAEKFHTAKGPVSVVLRYDLKCRETFQHLK